MLYAAAAAVLGIFNIIFRQAATLFSTEPAISRPLRCFSPKAASLHFRITPPLDISG